MYYHELLILIIYTIFAYCSYSNEFLQYYFVVVEINKLMPGSVTQTSGSRGPSYGVTRPAMIFGQRWGVCMLL
jgi:hypothetical protein